MPNLRSKVIRLAHAKPELREHLLPILKDAAPARRRPAPKAPKPLPKPKPLPSPEELLQQWVDVTDAPPGFSKKVDREGKTIHVTMRSRDEKIVFLYSFAISTYGTVSRDYSAQYRSDPDSSPKTFNTFALSPEEATEDLLKKIQKFLKQTEAGGERLVADFLSKVHYPGFDRRESPKWDNGLESFSEKRDLPAGSVVLSNPEDTIRVAVNAALVEDYRSGEFKVSGSGHTWFKKPGKGDLFYGFDRRGVSDSFYYDDPNGFASEMAEQLKKIEQAILRDATMIDVPGIPFRVSPADLQKHKERLARGEVVRFVPGGFGTGYVIMTKPTRYSKPLPAETAALFEVPRLFYETFDHD